MQAISTCTMYGTDGAMRSWSTTLDSSAWARAPSPRSTIAADGADRRLVSEAGTLVGVVSTKDVVRWLHSVVVLVRER